MQHLISAPAPSPAPIKSFCERSRFTRDSHYFSGRLRRPDRTQGQHGKPPSSSQSQSTGWSLSSTWVSGSRPYDPAADVDAPVEEAFRDIENIEPADLPAPRSEATLRPVVAVTADTNAVFETPVGVIHRINDRPRFVVHAERGHPQVANDDVVTLVTENLHATVDLDTDRFGEVFDEAGVARQPCVEGVDRGAG